MVEGDQRLQAPRAERLDRLRVVDERAQGMDVAAALRGLGRDRGGHVGAGLNAGLLAHDEARLAVGLQARAPLEAGETALDPDQRLLPEILRKYLIAGIAPEIPQQRFR